MTRIAIISIVFALFSLLPGNVMPEAEAWREYGIASWYGFCSPGILNTTANMEIFNEKDMTCATWNHPFGALLRVTNVRNGKSIIVRVNDRGPSKRLVREGRIIDLTKAAFSRIADLRQGLVMVKVEVVS